MSLWSILLRALLSLSLILNGVAAASAATHRHANPADMQSVITTPVKVSQTGEKVPCHQHQQADSAAMNDQPPVPAEHASKPDCCKSSTCGCACMHAAQAALPGLNLAAPLLDHSRSVRQLTLAHASPALPHLLRPPIGQVS
jgi:hypothetical protein